MILCGKLTSYEYNSENRDTKPDIRKFHRFTQTSTTQRSKLHSLGLMLYRINLAIPFEGSRPKYMFFWYYLQCFILTLKNCKYILFYQKCVHLEENTSIYCSRIIVLHVHAIVFFSKVHPVCHNIANVIKPGSNSNKTNSSKLYPPKKGYLRETWKSQNINPIYQNLKFTFSIIQMITNACQVCFSA